jgi:hypothetical protein
MSSNVFQGEHGERRQNGEHGRQPAARKPSKDFFFEKKKQKTFVFQRAWRRSGSNASGNQSFFASFCSQKEGLTSLFAFPNSL